MNNLGKIQLLENYYVAIGINNTIVSLDHSRTRAKEKAIAQGETCPKVVSVRHVREEFLLQYLTAVNTAR